MPAAPLPCSVIRPETLPLNGFFGVFVWEFAVEKSPLMHRLEARTKTRRRQLIRTILHDPLNEETSMILNQTPVVSIKNVSCRPAKAFSCHR
jgi:hypothetical protein